MWFGLWSTRKQTFWSLVPEIWENSILDFQKTLLYSRETGVFWLIPFVGQHLLGATLVCETLSPWQQSISSASFYLSRRTFHVSVNVDWRQAASGGIFLYFPNFIFLCSIQKYFNFIFSSHIWLPFVVEPSPVICNYSSGFWLASLSHMHIATNWFGVRWTLPDSLHMWMDVDKSFFSNIGGVCWAWKTTKQRNRSPPKNVFFKNPT